MNNPDSFFDDIDPKKKPDKPESITEDYDDNLEDCLSCGKQFEIHTTRELVVCAVTELRGDHPKG